jgi:hypothetical protein
MVRKGIDSSCCNSSQSINVFLENLQSLELVFFQTQIERPALGLSPRTQTESMISLGKTRFHSACGPSFLPYAVPQHMQRRLEDVVDTFRSSTI